MITIETLVEQGANVKLEITPSDLKMFAESIVQRTILAQQEEQKAVMQRGYLVPVKVGNKNMYAKSDVRRVQTGGKSESVTSYCKRKNG